MTSTAAPSGGATGRPAPDAGQVAITEASATTKLFAILLAGEHAAFTRLMIESQLAPDTAGQVALGKLIAAEVDHYNTLERFIRAAGIDPVDAITRYRGVFDQYHGATTPSNWNEVLIKAYIGDNLAADFYAEFIDVVPAVPIGDTIREVMSQTDHSQFACAHALEAIARDPDSTPTRELLGYAYCRLARFEEAAQVFRHWLAMEPDHPKARHLLAACSGEAVPPRASDAYVKSVFDDFADSFDGRLAKLDYRAPALTAAAIADCLGAGAGDLEVLDAGCGTGLCGPLLKPFAGRLIGVDLSSRMLDKARARGLYDDLCQAEIASYLQGQPERFDLIVSADTLVYFGLLDAVMTAGGRALRPGGLLCFTLEALDDAETGDYRLRYHGRYAHASTYVRARLEQAGLTVLRCDRETLRKEGGEPVPGWVVLARRPAMAPEALLATRS